MHTGLLLRVGPLRGRWWETGAVGGLVGDGDGGDGGDGGVERATGFWLTILLVCKVLAVVMVYVVCKGANAKIHRDTSLVSMSSLLRGSEVN